MVSNTVSLKKYISHENRTSNSYTTPEKSNSNSMSSSSRSISLSSSSNIKKKMETERTKSNKRRLQPAGGCFVGPAAEIKSNRSSFSISNSNRQIIIIGAALAIAIATDK